jgi:hypothetical protein
MQTIDGEQVVNRGLDEIVHVVEKADEKTRRAIRR